MKARIGFVLLTHDKPAQFLRLVQRLMRLYDNPPIACHHDFSKCSLEEYDFPKGVTFVQPSINTSWGGVQTYRAFLAALNALYERPDSPDWFVLLSGTDYPVRPAQTVREELTRGGFDAYLDHRLVEYPWTPDPRVTYAPKSFASAEWVPIAYDRYVALRIGLPWYSWTRRKPVKVHLEFIRSKWLTRLFTPYSERLKCYGGSQWFTGNRKVAERLMTQKDDLRALFSHLTRRLFTDETITQTILCNQPDLKISKKDLRYIDWSQGGYHPKTLGMEDIPRILASGAHFARKFDLALGSEVFDAIDDAVDAASN
jgi:hypothetical protein